MLVTMTDTDASPNHIHEVALRAVRVAASFSDE
jgi:hypothetical protein